MGEELKIECAKSTIHYQIAALHDSIRIFFNDLMNLHGYVPEKRFDEFKERSKSISFILGDLNDKKK